MDQVLCVITLQVFLCMLTLLHLEIKCPHHTTKVFSILRVMTFCTSNVLNMCLPPPMLILIDSIFSELKTSYP